MHLFSAAAFAGHQLGQSTPEQFGIELNKRHDVVYHQRIETVFSLMKPGACNTFLFETLTIMISDIEGSSSPWHERTDIDSP
jgi:hypothetical protein